MSDPSGYLEKVSRFLEALSGDFIGKKLCVCLSGGADSVSLLVSLYKLKDKFKFDLSAAHVNHMLRGAESDRDERFCRELCEKLGLRHFQTRIDIQTLSKSSGKSIEETARDARYSYFKELGKKENIDYFATAHTKNDNAETVYMNIIRGTTVSGLCGIPPVNGNIMRPLLTISREENEQFLEENGFSYVTDSTNSDNDITRNYIRNVLLPGAKKLNPQVIEAADRLSAYTRSDEDYFNKVLDTITEDTKDVDLHPALLRRRLQRAYAEISGGKALMSVHLESLMALSLNKTGKVLSMPGGIVARVSDGKINFILEKELRNIKKLSDDGIYELNFGENSFADGKVNISYRRISSDSNELYSNENIYNNYTHIELDFGKIVGNIKYRKRQKGDRIFCRGVNRSIKKEFIEKRVPVYMRDAVPVFFDNEGIIYVPFIGASDRVYSHGNRENAVVIDVQITGISQERAGF
jgi:tRNA(Ile)-lysidine synthase